MSKTIFVVTTLDLRCLCVIFCRSPPQRY